jgi:hypothetical protein
MIILIIPVKYNIGTIFYIERVGEIFGTEKEFGKIFIHSKSLSIVQ